MHQPTEFRNLTELRTAKRLLREQLVDSSKSLYKEVFVGTVPSLNTNIKAQGTVQKWMSYGFMAWRGYLVSKNIFKFFSLFKGKKKSKKGLFW